MHTGPDHTNELQTESIGILIQKIAITLAYEAFCTVAKLVTNVKTEEVFRLHCVFDVLKGNSPLSYLHTTPHISYP